MGRTVLIVGLLVVLAVSGCTADGEPPATVPASTSARPVVPYAGLTVKQVYAQVRSAVAAAESVHVRTTGRIGKRRSRCDLRITRQPAATGRCSLNGQALSVRRLDDVMYLRGGAAAWRTYIPGLDPRVARTLAARWVRLPRDPTLEWLFSTTSMANTLPQGHRTARRGTELDRSASFDGRPAVALVEDDSDEEAAVLYVSPTAPALPVAFEFQYADVTVEYVSWNEPVSVERPRSRLLSPADPPGRSA